MSVSSHDSINRPSPLSENTSELEERGTSWIEMCFKPTANKASHTTLGVESDLAILGPAILDHRIWMWHWTNAVSYLVTMFPPRSDQFASSSLQTLTSLNWDLGLLG